MCAGERSLAFAEARDDEGVAGKACARCISEPSVTNITTILGTENRPRSTRTPSHNHRRIRGSASSNHFCACADSPVYCMLCLVCTRRCEGLVSSLETRPSPSSTRVCSVSYNYAWEHFRKQKAWYILSRDACRDCHKASSCGAVT